MADDRQVNPAPDGVDAPEDGVADAIPETLDTTRWASAARHWQIPVILVSTALILGGFIVASRGAKPPDFDAALDQIDGMISRAEFDEAAERLKSVIEPNLGIASPLVRGRFHATLADWLSATQAREGVSLPEANARIMEQYGKAREFRYPLGPRQLARWGYAALAVSDIDRASDRLADLDALDRSAGDSELISEVRNDLLRRIVERNLDRGRLSAGDLIAELGSYRSDPNLRVEDQSWAIARQAELRIADGLPQEAIHHLLVDMRRLEARTGDTEGEVFGPLYVLLGRAYYDLGDYERARFYLDRSLESLGPAVPPRGDALVLLGQIDQVADEYASAFERFDAVVQDFQGTRSALPGLLGRAETFSLLGDDDRSLQDFAEVRTRIVDEPDRRDINAEIIASSLVDRCDANIATGNLDRALQFILLAEGLFPVDETPTDVLLRIASVSHQIASARIETALADMDPAVRDIVDIDPGVKYEANVHLKRAGDYYVRHARALRATPEGDEAWAQSLWWGADSYDLAGWYDLAITHFKEYLAGTQGEARRPEATFRIAQGYHALQDYPSALEYYQRVLGEHPNSTFAGRSYVPLARCQAATGDYAAAEASLQHVLGGSAHSIEPDAVDYREAQIDSGKLFYAQGKFVPAIEALDKALRRYPDDPRVNALRYTLADAYRQQSLKVGADMETAVLPGSELERLDEMRRSYLASAADLFDQVRAAYEARNAHHLQRFEQDMLRAAYLYRGDCAFLLGRLREAIEIYGETARKYSQHHSSMLALIQIVECYHRLGQTEQARIAHLRALRRLEELPDEAFSEPDSLLDRATWERWLQNTPLGSVARVPEGTTP